MQFDEITSIEKLDVRETIDISVSGNNLFYANGILAHNSGAHADEGNMDTTATSDCIDPNSLVDHITKGKIPLGDLELGDKIKGKEDEWRTVLKLFPLKRKKKYKITLDDGKVIYASEDHKFPTANNGIISIKSGLTKGDVFYVS